MQPGKDAGVRHPLAGIRMVGTGDEDERLYRAGRIFHDAFRPPEFYKGAAEGEIFLPVCSGLRV